MKKLLKNIVKCIRGGSNAEVVLRRHRSVSGCCAVAICRQSDGGIWAIEKTIQAAKDRQSEGSVGNITFLAWVKVMPSDELNIINEVIAK